MTVTDREQGYLHEMGIDVWVKRPERSPEHASGTPAESVSAGKPAASGPSESRADESEVASEVASDLASDLAAEVRTEFYLDLGVCACGELLALGTVIDAMDAKLLQNIVLAAVRPGGKSSSEGSCAGTPRGIGELPRLSSFRWPQARTVGTTGAAGAAKALRAYLLRQINEKGARRLLLLGDALGQLLAQSDNFIASLKRRDGSSVQALQGPDLRYLRYHGEAKRILWRDLSRWQR